MTLCVTKVPVFQHPLSLFQYFVANVKERFERLLKTVQDTSAKKAAQFVGKIAYVLVEEKNAQEEGFVTGRTGQNYLVHFKGDSSLIGKIVPVKLCESKGFYYYGERQ